MEATKTELNLRESQHASVLLDVNAAHRTPSVLTALRKHGFEVQIVPAKCTSELQPLDLSVNALESRST